MREGRRGKDYQVFSAKYFNSRPCERGDTSNVNAYASSAIISIHAPARGATSRGYPGRQTTWTFQFTPLREGRLQQLRLAAVAPLFQFTPLREGRPFRQDSAGITGKFQFTPLREGRPFRQDSAGITGKFQFTPLREGRPGCACLMSSSSNFNSRPCERGDGISAKRIAKELISIHAPARGATIHRHEGGPQSRFQFTPLREGRPLLRGRRIKIMAISIHAPARGATIGAAFLVGVVGISIHAPARGATAAAACCCYRPLISIHAPARGATAKSNKICSVFSAIIEKNSQLLDNTSFLKHPVF